MQDKRNDRPDDPRQKRNGSGNHSPCKQRVYRLAVAIDIEGADKSKAGAAGEQGSAKNRKRNGNEAGFPGRWRGKTNIAGVWQFGHEVSSDCERDSTAGTAGVTAARYQR